MQTQGTCVASSPAPQRCRMHAGCFQPRALAFEVHAWVQEHLRALEPFELSSPVLPGKDKRLAHAGTVADAGLMPTCQLYFRWSPGGEPVVGPALSDAALALAQAEVHEEHV
jgi:hypothetical protein